MIPIKNNQKVEWNKLIKGTRMIQGLTQEELAEKLNIQRTQLLQYEKGIRPINRTRNRVIEYIKQSKLPRYEEVLQIYSLDSYLSKNYLWGKLMDGLQTHLGLNNSEIANILKIEHISMESWKSKKVSPLPKHKSKILRLIKKNNLKIKDLLKYPKIDWTRLVIKIKKDLKISNTLLGKLMKSSRIKEIVEGKSTPLPKLRKEILELDSFLKEKRDIRDVIFKKRKQRLFENKNKVLKYSEEVTQWNKRRNLSKIIGFRMMHPKEKPFLNKLKKLLENKGFETFTNPILANKNLETFNVDLYAIKQNNGKKLEICIEARDRSSAQSVHVAFLENLNRLLMIKDKMDLDYCFLAIPSDVGRLRTLFGRSNLGIIDKKILTQLESSKTIEELLSQDVKIQKLLTGENLGKYMEFNHLTNRDVSFITGMAFNKISEYIKENKNLNAHKNKFKKLIKIMKSKGVGYIKFYRNKHIFTNKTFLKLKAYSKILNLTEKKFKNLFGIKPSEIVDKCLKNKVSIDPIIIDKIKKYAQKNNYNWSDINKRVDIFINEELHKWELLEQASKILGWKLVKFINVNGNKNSSKLENQVLKKLFKKYKYLFKNVQVYFKELNQLREIDILAFNTKKDLTIIECKTKKPTYGFKVILNDLQIKKKFLNAKDSWLVTSDKINLNNKEETGILNPTEL